MQGWGAVIFSHAGLVNKDWGKDLVEWASVTSLSYHDVN